MRVSSGGVGADRNMKSAEFVTQYAHLDELREQYQRAKDSLAVMNRKKDASKPMRAKLTAEAIQVAQEVIKVCSDLGAHVTLVTTANGDDDN